MDSAGSLYSWIRVAGRPHDWIDLAAILHGWIHLAGHFYLQYIHFWRGIALEFVRIKPRYAEIGGRRLFSLCTSYSFSSRWLQRCNGRKRLGGVVSQVWTVYFALAYTQRLYHTYDHWYIYSPPPPNILVPLQNATSYKVSQVSKRHQSHQSQNVTSHKTSPK
jgi:hypothetical protein